MTVVSFTDDGIGLVETGPTATPGEILSMSQDVPTPKPVPVSTPSKEEEENARAKRLQKIKKEYMDKMIAQYERLEKYHQFAQRLIDEDEKTVADLRAKKELLIMQYIRPIQRGELEVKEIKEELGPLIGEVDQAFIKIRTLQFYVIDEIYDSVKSGGGATEAAVKAQNESKQLLSDLKEKIEKDLMADQ